MNDAALRRLLEERETAEQRAASETMHVLDALEAVRKRRSACRAARVRTGSLVQSVELAYEDDHIRVVGGALGEQESALENELNERRARLAQARIERTAVERLLERRRQAALLLAERAEERERDDMNVLRFNRVVQEGGIAPP